MASKTRRRGGRRRGGWINHLSRRRKAPKQLRTVYPYDIDCRYPKSIGWLQERIATHDQVCTECSISLGQTSDTTWVLARAEFLNWKSQQGELKKDVRYVTLRTDENGTIMGATIPGPLSLWVIDDVIPELGWFADSVW